MRFYTDSFCSTRVYEVHVMIQYIKNKDDTRKTIKGITLEVKENIRSKREHITKPQENLLLRGVFN